MESNRFGGEKRRLAIDRRRETPGRRPAPERDGDRGVADQGEDRTGCLSGDSVGGSPNLTTRFDGLARVFNVGLSPKPRRTAATSNDDTSRFVGKKRFPIGEATVPCGASS